MVKLDGVCCQDDLRSEVRDEIRKPLARCGLKFWMKVRFGLVQQEKQRTPLYDAGLVPLERGEQSGERDESGPRRRNLKLAIPWRDL